MTVTPVSSPVVDESSPIRVLIAEDETHLGTILEQFMTARGFHVRVVRDGRSALQALREEAFDVALLDVVMPELDGLEVLRLVREEPLPPEIIVITGNGTIETALAALKLGAYDFLSKPYRMAEIEALVRRAWEKRLLVRENRYLRARLERLTPVASFLTQFAPLRAVLSMVANFAASPLPVLITGEVGSGKRTIARLLHDHGARPRGPFVRVDCAALAPSVQVHELLGLDRDGVNAAHRPGVFELAAGGTLYLEQADALTLPAQQALAAALDAGEFTRVGATQRLPFDVRVVASCTTDPSSRTAGNPFDEALLHRLSAMRVTLPALRDRAVDIALLAQHFAERTSPSLRISGAALATLEQYRWPGNVQELRLVIERAAMVAEHSVIEPAHLSISASGGTLTPAEPAASEATAAIPEAPSLGELERRHIAEVLERTSWHQGRAAELLGISPKTLYRKIREYGFKRPSGRTS